MHKCGCDTGEKNLGLVSLLCKPTCQMLIRFLCTVVNTQTSRHSGWQLSLRIWRGLKWWNSLSCSNLGTMTKSGLTHVFGRQTFSHRTILFAHSHSTVLSHANKNPPNCLQHLLIKNESPSLSSSVSKLTDIVRRVPSNVCFPFTVENILVKYSSCLIFICRLVNSQ